MARVWTTPLDPARLAHDAHIILERAVSDRSAEPWTGLPWIDDETRAFIDYWFAEPQKSCVAALARALWRTRLPARDALMIALSRLIVAKDKGASLARDVSHSRPHKVAPENDFDVFAGFRRTVNQLGQRLKPEYIRGVATVELGDSRNATGVPNESVDCIVTSPPYLNALDYLRGHRLGLVWLGYTVAEARSIRSESIGTERILDDIELDESPYISESEVLALPQKYRGWIKRYMKDAHGVVSESRRTLKSDGSIVLVVGNSSLRGVSIDNAQIYVDRLGHFGFRDITVAERGIPAAHRYLPPPTGGTGLHARMRTEVIVRASAPAR